MVGTGFSCTGNIPGSLYSFLLENKLMDDPFYRDNELKALELASHDYGGRVQTGCARRCFYLSSIVTVSPLGTNPKERHPSF